MSTATKPFNICDTLRKRLDEINNKREVTQVNKKALFEKKHGFECVGKESRKES